MTWTIQQNSIHGSVHQYKIIMFTRNHKACKTHYDKGGSLQLIVEIIATLTWGADREHGPSWVINHSPR